MVERSTSKTSATSSLSFLRTKNGKTSKQWSHELGYRITWRSRFKGITVQPYYYACVKVVRDDGAVWWDFVNHRRPYRTLKAAEKACEQHKRMWDKFVALGDAGGNRVSRLKDLVSRGGLMMRSLPVWVRVNADPKLIEMQFGNNTFS